MWKILCKNIPALYIDIAIFVLGYFILFCLTLYNTIAYDNYDLLCIVYEGTEAYKHVADPSTLAVGA